MTLHISYLYNNILIHRPISFGWWRWRCGWRIWSMARLKRWYPGTRRLIAWLDLETTSGAGFGAYWWLY